jgi:hypothetical protein
LERGPRRSLSQARLSHGANGVATPPLRAGVMALRDALSKTNRAFSG